MTDWWMQTNEMDMGRKLKHTQGGGIQVAVSAPPAQMLESKCCYELHASVCDAAFVPVSLWNANLLL